jgi:hypothetical protein
MKLDYLASGSPDCPLIRLYDFSTAEVAQLHALVSGLASGATERVEIHRLPFVEPVGGCRLALVRRPWDQAVVRGTETTEFECRFTVAAWDNLAGLVEPFMEGANGFQWLAGAPGEAALLLTASGQW